MYKLSNLAAEDFDSIYEFTWRKFGPSQADKYTSGLDAFLTLLARNPLMGSDRADLMEGIRTHVHARHTIFYKEAGGKVLVVRILHQQMDPLVHFE